MKAASHLLLAALLALPAVAEPQLPAGFTAATIVEKINAATALAVAPDGRVFYAEQTGAIRVVKNGALLPRPAIDLGERLDTWWERGLIGMTLHPDFPHTPYLFAVYTAKAPFTRHVVSRFTVVGDHLDPDSEVILLEGDDQSKLGGKVPHGHQGGPICFGRDGMLYIGIGEQTAGKPSQALDSLLGKILRIAPDGSIPEDNPFFDETTGKYRSIYATGIRNPFGLAVEPETGRLIETDVGGSAFEEINEIVAGGNYGWPHAEGMSDDDRFTDPLHAYPPAIGRSICGAMFYPEGAPFPREWHGKLFFVDWADHWVKALDLDAPDELIPFAEGFAAPVAIAAAPDGSVYVLNRDTRWRDGEKFEENTGSLVRIEYREGFRPPAQPRFAATLSETGVFADVATLQPADGFHRFSLSSPAWLPGVRARRWINIPEQKRIEILPGGKLRFPEATRIVHHFERDSGQRHETHVYRANSDGTWKAAAYRWEEGDAGASLVTESGVTEIPGEARIRWFSPGPELALDPELSFLGFVLQLELAQLHAGGQLDEWHRRGWIDRDLSRDAVAALAPLDDGEAGLDHRVRSYLDSNCALCHRPGGPSRGGFDLRVTTPLSDAGLVGAEPIAGDLGVEGAKLIVPGSPEKSLLLQRMARTDPFRMPPVAVHDVPSPALPLVEQWIREMAPAPAVPAGGGVQLDENAVDPSAANLPAFKITTPSATYFLEKSGAGLSSLLDRDGNDWLGFHPGTATGAGGEYRGFPNAVYKSAGNYFHARNAGTDPSACKVIRNDGEQVVIEAVSDNERWACRYTFTPTHCTFTMTRMPAGMPYWVLYEGTPGGRFDDSDWWISSASDRKQPMTVNSEGDLPAPEWFAFGDPNLKRALVLHHHEDDQHPDRFYQMEHKMTVFGFGRQGIDRLLDSVPQSVSIRFVESDDPDQIAAAVTFAPKAEDR